MASRTQTNRRSRSGRSSGARTRRNTRSGSRSRSSGRNTRTTTRSRSQGSARSTSRRTQRRPSVRQDRMMREVQPKAEEVEELVLQALETELGGVQVYEAAVQAAQNEELREEWEEYLEQTRHHVEVVQGLIQKLGLDENKETPGRDVVRALGQGFQSAQQGGKPEHAELVAAECVTLAETKDHLNWTLLSELAKTGFEGADAIREACDEVEDEEDEHLYHTMGWTRELWIQGLGLPSALPPPEEEEDVKSMAGAARAKAQRQRFVEAETEG
jgi:rubrerythrin